MGGERHGDELYGRLWDWHIAMVAEEMGMLGSVGIIGLYVTILVTVGGVIRNFLLPQVSDIM